MAHLHCCKCAVDMRVDKNGVGVDYGFYHVYPGDRHKCPVCGVEVIYSVGRAINDKFYKTQDEYLVMKEAMDKEIHAGSRGAKIQEMAGTITRDPDELLHDAKDIEAEIMLDDTEGPAVVVTDDGFRFKRQNDGSYTDGDITFDSFDDFYERYYERKK